MKNILMAIGISVVCLYSSCEKCYQCHNECKTCSYTYPDTILTIHVCSDVFGKEYYTEYIDSLSSPALGWVCNDAAPSKTVRFCGSQTTNNVNLINKRDAGMICAPE